VKEAETDGRSLRRHGSATGSARHLLED